MNTILIVIIVWLILCIMILSWQLTDVVSNTKRNAKKSWHILTFLTAWVVGIFSPFIFIYEAIGKLFERRMK